MKAWIAHFEGFDEAQVVFAETRAKAGWYVVRSYWEAFGRRRGVWPKFTLRRASVYDSSRLADSKQPVFSEEYVRTSFEAKNP